MHNAYLCVCAWLLVLVWNIGSWDGKTESVESNPGVMLLSKVYFSWKLHLGILSASYNCLSCIKYLEYPIKKVWTVPQTWDTCYPQCGLTIGSWMLITFIWTFQKLLWLPQEGLIIPDEQWCTYLKATRRRTKAESPFQTVTIQIMLSVKLASPSALTGKCVDEDQVKNILWTDLTIPTKLQPTNYQPTTNLLPTYHWQWC